MYIHAILRMLVHDKEKITGYTNTELAHSAKRKRNKIRSTFEL